MTFCVSAILTQSFHVGSEGMNFPTSSSNCSKLSTQRATIDLTYARRFVEPLLLARRDSRLIAEKVVGLLMGQQSCRSPVQID